MTVASLQLMILISGIIDVCGQFDSDAGTFMADSNRYDFSSINHKRYPSDDSNLLIMSFL